MTAVIRIAMYLVAGMIAGSTGIVDFNADTGFLRIDVNGLSALIGAQGALAGGIGGTALAWWRVAKRKGWAT